MLDRTRGIRSNGLSAVSVFRGKNKTLKMYSAVFPDINLQYLVRELAILREFVED